MRNKITHGYSNIDRAILKSTIEDNVPNLKKHIETIVDKKIINDPYSLYEFDYDDLVKENKMMGFIVKTLNQNDIVYQKEEKDEEKEM